MLVYNILAIVIVIMTKFTMTATKMLRLNGIMTETAMLLAQYQPVQVV